MALRALVKRLAHRAGFDVVRHPGPATSRGRRVLRMARHGVDLVIDVGANTGQYATELRSLGYAGSLLSIEPLPTAYEALNKAASRDARWHTVSCAVGREPASATLHVAGNSVSSSILAMLPSHAAAAPTSRAIGTVEVPVRPLSSILEDSGVVGARPFLKIDTQGYELEVLEGAGQRLDDIVGVQVEMSLVPLYRGAPTMTELVEWLERRGFWLADIEPEFNDPQTGRLLQVNGLFFRPRAEGDRRQ